MQNKWGFDHLGRFAAAYRRHSGEPPSATLRRARSLRAALLEDSPGCRTTLHEDPAERAPLHQE